MFTQNHYKAIAQVLREERDRIARDASPGSAPSQDLAINELQARLIKLFERDNPRFKSLIFIEAASNHGHRG